MNLFQINENYRVLENNDELDPELIKDTLDSIQDARDVKLDNLATLIEKTNEDTEWVSNKIKKLQEQKKVLENKLKSLMNYMTDALDDAHIKQLHTKHHILKTRNFRASVHIIDDTELPKKFIKQEEHIVIKTDKKAIYQALKNGEEVKGAELKPNRKTVIS